MNQRCVTLLIAILGLGGPASASADTEEEAKKRFDQAELYMKAGVYEKAISEYRASYELAPSAHLLLFNIGLAYERWGKRREALAHYEKYLEREPEGRKAPEARARLAALESQLEREAEEADEREAEKEAAASPAEPEEEGGPASAHDAARRAAEREESARGSGRVEVLEKRRAAGGADEGERISWGWIAAGAAAVGAGLAADLIPDSARNGETDATDFIPIALYGTGGTFLFFGFF